MMPDTDFHMLQKLREQYTPKERGIVSSDESTLIRSTLRLAVRTDVELQNIRDMAVMLYGQDAQNATNKNDHAKAIEIMDAMSAITAVIDMEKSDRGLEV